MQRRGSKFAVHDQPRFSKWRKRFRWFAVATLFTAIGLSLLKLFVGVWLWPYAAATFVQSEICNVLRFFANDRWVFGFHRPTWKRFWQYHVANALAFVVWWLGANALKSAGMNYLVASVAAMIGSFAISWVTNFGWIWKKKHHTPAEPEPQSAQ